jgi:Ser/Thr protein kinase RdoA (MazF antagonist)
MVKSEIIDYFAEKYLAESASMQELSTGENFIYSYQKDQQKYILRITSGARRNKQQLAAEVEWILFINRHSGPAINLVAATDGQYLQVYPESIPSWYAYSYKMVEGDFPGDKQWDKKLFYQYGKVAGNLHKIAKEYTPLQQVRHSWEEDDNLLACLNMSGEDKIISTICQKLVDKLSKIEKNEFNFGLIHADLHCGNMGFEQNEIKVYDFDDCQYDFYVRELAVAIFYAYWHPNYLDSILAQNPADSKFALDFTVAFLQGYRSETEFEIEMLDYIEDYLKLQRIILYQILSEESSANLGRWLQVKDKWRQEIISEQDYVNLAFASLKEKLWEK